MMLRYLAQMLEKPGAKRTGQKTERQRPAKMSANGA